MICRIIKFILLFCVTILSNIVYSQEAEKLFNKDYSKIGLVFQPASLNGFYVSDKASPSINFVNSFSPQFGFVYNFAQQKNFNFKTGIIAKLFRPSFDIIISNEDLNAGFDYSNELSQFELSNQYVFSESIEVEYFYPLSKKLNLVLGIGVSLDIRTGGGNDVLFVGVNDFNTNEYKRILIIDSNEQQITGSNDISLGFNYKAKFGLIQLDFFNNSQLLSYPKTGIYQFVNLKNNQTKTGVYNVKGNYSGFSLTFSPKKGLLIKKSK
jgi:hypothetical protein